MCVMSCILRSVDGIVGSVSGVVCCVHWHSVHWTSCSVHCVVVGGGGVVYVTGCAGWFM